MAVTVVAEAGAVATGRVQAVRPQAMTVAQEIRAMTVDPADMVARDRQPMAVAAEAMVM